MPKSLHFRHKMIHLPQRFIFRPSDGRLIKREAGAAPHRAAALTLTSLAAGVGFSTDLCLSRVSQPHCPCMTVTPMPPKHGSAHPRLATAAHLPPTRSHCFPYLNNVSVSTESAMFAFLSSPLSGWFSLFSLKIVCRRRLLLW